MSSVVIVCHLLYAHHASLWYPDANVSFLCHYNTLFDVSYVTIVSKHDFISFIACLRDPRTGSGSTYGLTSGDCAVHTRLYGQQSPDPQPGFFGRST